MSDYVLNLITSWITPNASVLDLGCGDGVLLEYLIEHRQVSAYGLENDAKCIRNCIAKRLNVLQLDLEKGLDGFTDHFFDYAVMNFSLQAVRNVKILLSESLRVSHEAIVSIPNFGYWQHRDSLAKGHVPVSSSLPHQWFDTPNVRFFTLSDFEALCLREDLQIVERQAFDDGVPIHEQANYYASVAFYRLAKKPVHTELC